MARVTDAEVKVIIDTTLTDLSSFITTANLIVNEDLEPKGTLSEDRLKQIELYLSAHFVTMRERQLKSEEFGDSKDVFLGEVGEGYASSTYGQQALALDSCGVLAIQGNPKARFEVV